MLKDLISKDAKSIKTHLVVGTRDAHLDMGITGFYDADVLLNSFAEHDAQYVSYEKDYGDGAIAVRTYLAIYVTREEYESFSGKKFGF